MAFNAVHAPHQVPAQYKEAYARLPEPRQTYAGMVAAMDEAGVDRAVRRRRAAELLEYVGLSNRAGHRPSELSGGEMQRVAIARALANRPRLLLADEPTGELDQQTGGQIVTLLDELHKDGTAVVVVTHDMAVAARAHRLLTMRDGQIVESSSR